MTLFRRVVGVPIKKSQYSVSHASPVKLNDKILSIVDSGFGSLSSFYELSVSFGYNALGLPSRPSLAEPPAPTGCRQVNTGIFSWIQWLKRPVSLG